MLDNQLPSAELLEPCPFEGCGLPYSLEDERLMKSSDPTGCAVVAFYRCVMGHHWTSALGAGVPDD